MTKKTYCMALLLPALFYYLALDLWPQQMSALFLGWPLSVLLGLLAMAWAVMVGLLFAQRVSAAKAQGGPHEQA